MLKTNQLLQVQDEYILSPIKQHFKYLNIFQAKIQPAYTSYAKPQINIDDETIARDIKDLNGILKDTGLDEEQAKNYHGKWQVFFKTEASTVNQLQKVIYTLHK